MTPTEARKALETAWSELRAVDEQLRLANEARAKLRRSFQTLTAVERMIAEMETVEVAPWVPAGVPKAFGGENDV